MEGMGGGGGGGGGKSYILYQLPAILPPHWWQVALCWTVKAFLTAVVVEISLLMFLLWLPPVGTVECHEALLDLYFIFVLL